MTKDEFVQSFMDSFKNKWYDKELRQDVTSIQFVEQELDYYLKKQTEWAIVDERDV